MEKIKNPWIGHPSYHCFGCDPNNPVGLHMQFFQEDNEVVCLWKPQSYYQGWIDTMHGGILATLIDEACGWVLFHLYHASGYTTRLNLKYRKAVSSNDPQLTIRAHATRQAHGLLFLEASITNAAGELCVEGEAVYFTLPDEKARKLGLFLSPEEKDAHDHKLS